MSCQRCLAKPTPHKNFSIFQTFIDIKSKIDPDANAQESSRDFECVPIYRLRHAADFPDSTCGVRQTLVPRACHRKMIPVD